MDSGTFLSEFALDDDSFDAMELDGGIHLIRRSQLSNNIVEFVLTNSKRFGQRQKERERPPWEIMPRCPSFQRSIEPGVPVYILFELASGYALFRGRNIDGQVGNNFESTDLRFELIKYTEFKSSHLNALYQLSSVSSSILTEELVSFLVETLGEPDPKDVKFYLSSFHPGIACATKMPVQSSADALAAIRRLRRDICILLGIRFEELQKAQRDLAFDCAVHLLDPFYKGTSAAATSSYSPSNGDVVVVEAHRVEGVFTHKDKDGQEVICTKNLVPGRQSVYREEFISAKVEDGKEIAEYRVWNRCRSNLAAAILNGVKDIWVKPGSRVLCLNDVFGYTLSHLSDLVGPSGLVYAIAESEVVLKNAKIRHNVVPIYCKLDRALVSQRMLLSMVDVICADASLHATDPISVELLHGFCLHYLKAGGHFLVVLTKEMSANLSKEHQILDTVELEVHGYGYYGDYGSMVVGQYRAGLEF